MVDKWREEYDKGEFPEGEYSTGRIWYGVRTIRKGHRSLIPSQSDTASQNKGLTLKVTFFVTVRRYCLYIKEFSCENFFFYIISIIKNIQILFRCMSLFYY